MASYVDEKILEKRDWKQMIPKLVRIKYPSEFRLQCILTSLGLSVNMEFSVFHQENIHKKLMYRNNLQ